MPRTRSTLSSRIQSCSPSSSIRASAASATRGARDAPRRSSRRRPRCPSHVDQRPEREPLADERHQDHGEGEEDDQVAVRERRRRRRSCSGMASAAASDTEPRMPAQPTTSRSRRRAPRALAPRAGRSPGSGTATVNSQASRTPITTDAHEQRPRGSARRRCGPRGCRAPSGSCRPTSRNRTAFSRNVRISQTAMLWMPHHGVVSSGVCQPM